MAFSLPDRSHPRVDGDSTVALSWAGPQGRRHGNTGQTFHHCRHKVVTFYPCVCVSPPGVCQMFLWCSLDVLLSGASSLRRRSRGGDPHACSEHLLPRGCCSLIWRNECLCVCVWLYSCEADFCPLFQDFGFVPPTPSTARTHITHTNDKAVGGMLGDHKRLCAL